MAQTSGSGSTVADDGRGGRGRGGGRGRRAWVAVIAFLAGAVATALVAGVLMGLDIADGDEGPLSQPGATEPAPTTPPATTATGSVPEPCLQAAEYNDTLTQAIDDIALGVRDQDARALQETLDTIQEAQPEGEAASDECRALAGATEPAEEDADGEAEETTEPSTEVSPEPTEGEPSPTPTP